LAYVHVSLPQCKRKPSIEIGNRFFHYKANFKYLEKAYTVHEKFKILLNSGDACYYSIPNSLYTHMLSTNAKTKIYKTIIFFVWGGGWGR
jgi:hypothetical protein